MKPEPLEGLLVSLESGTRPKGGVSADSGEIPSIGGEHVSADGTFDFTSIKRIPRAFFEQLRSGRVAPLDILVVKDGATTGKTAFVRKGFPFNEAAVNEHVFCLRVDSRKAVPGYVFQFLRSPRGQRAIALDFRGATVGGISRGFARRTLLSVPALTEQRRIADVLDRAEALRAKRRATLAGLDGLIDTTFLNLFGDSVENPKHWPFLACGEAADVQGGLQVSMSRNRLPCEAPYLRVANVHRGRLDLSEIKTLRASPAELDRTSLKKDDLLVVEGHGNPAEIGRVALWDGSIPRCTHQNHLIRVRFDVQKIIPCYGTAYLNSPGGRRHLLRSGKTTSGLNTISTSEVRNAPVAVPPISLQREFACRVSAIEKLKAAHRASLAKLDELFASLQHRAFRGEL